MALPENMQFFDHVKQDWITIREPQTMLEKTASRLVSQHPDTQRKFQQYLRLGMTPYRAMLEITNSGNR